jgi:hypothetical protein
MAEQDNAPDSHFMGHPEVRVLLNALFTNLINESDRGAVLLAASEVDLHLRKLLETVAPSSMSRKRLASLLEYPGALSTFGARCEIAFVCRLISASIYRAIGHLRRIRNDVAHKPLSFRLADHQEQIRNMYELGPGVPAAINQWACEIIVHHSIRNVMELKDPLKDEDPMFASPDDALEYLSRHPDLLGPLEERRHRVELALGVALICGVIVHYRDKLKTLLPGDELLIGLTNGPLQSHGTA